MLKPSLMLVGILVIGLAGCAAQDKAACPAPAPDAPASDASAYTTTRAIHVDGQLKGFLCTYEAIPITAGISPKAPAGSTFIKDLEFNNLGFITPKGELWRFGPGNIPEKVHQAGLIENLAVFFGTPERSVSLKDL